MYIFTDFETHHRRGRFSLSSRTLLELQSYLKANYEEDIYECTLCFELLTVGVRCYIPACSARLHNHCYKRFARDSRICPTCRTDWSQPQNLLKIGEDAVKDGQDSRSTRRRNDDDETDDTEEDEPEPEPKPTTSKAKPPKGKKWAPLDFFTSAIHQFVAGVCKKQYMTVLMTIKEYCRMRRLLPQKVKLGVEGGELFSILTMY